MPKYHAILEAVADGRKITYAFTVDLPVGSGGVDVVRAAEAYAAARGWSRLVVATGMNGTVLPEVPSAARPARRGIVPDIRPQRRDRLRGQKDEPSTKVIAALPPAVL